MGTSRNTALVAGLGAAGAALVRSMRDTWNVIAVDIEQVPLDALRASATAEERGELTAHAGDATSALVLRKAGAAAADVAVACTGDDEINLEICRVLAAEIGVARRIALLREPASEPAYRAAGVEVVSRAAAAAIAAGSLLQRGHKIAQGVGLGTGEILEVEVLPNSPVVRRPLKDLHAKSWIVGAIFRGGRLVIPHGETMLAPADRVLLIGDPSILPGIAAFVRSGESEFPLQYGANIVALCDPGLAAAAAEIEYLLRHTKAEILDIVSCDDNERELAEVLAELERRSVRVITSCETTGGDFETLARRGAQKDVGLFLQMPEAMGPLARIGLKRTRTGRTLEMLDSPSLVPRGTFPYRRLLLAMTELPFPDEALLLAVDVARLLDAELAIGVVHQPELVVGTAARDAFTLRHKALVDLAAMYRVAARTLELSGNPVREVIRASGDHDLVIVPFARGRSRSLIRPDIALNILQRARCSAMALPH